MNNIIGLSKETAKMEKELTNLIIGAVLSGQKGVMVNSMEVSWKPLKANLSSKEREAEAQRIAKMNIQAILG
jgi:hypothetical protein